MTFVIEKSIQKKMEKFLKDARIYEKFLAITTIIVILDATKKL